MKIHLQGVSFNKESDTSIVRNENELDLQSTRESCFVAIANLDTTDGWPGRNLFIVRVDIPMNLEKEVESVLLRGIEYRKPYREDLDVETELLAATAVQI